MKQLVLSFFGCLFDSAFCWFFVFLRFFHSNLTFSSFFIISLRWEWIKKNKQRKPVAQRSVFFIEISCRLMEFRIQFFFFLKIIPVLEHQFEALFSCLCSDSFFVMKFQFSEYFVICRLYGLDILCDPLIYWTNIQSEKKSLQIHLNAEINFILSHFKFTKIGFLHFILILLRKKKERTIFCRPLFGWISTVLKENLDLLQRLMANGFFSSHCEIPQFIFHHFYDEFHHWNSRMIIRISIKFQ